MNFQNLELEPLLLVKIDVYTEQNVHRESEALRLVFKWVHRLFYDPLESRFISGTQLPIFSRLSEFGQPKPRNRSTPT